MRRTLQIAALTAVLSIAGLPGPGTPSARAQGFSISIGSGYRGYGSPGYGYSSYGYPGYGYSSYNSSISGYGAPGFYTGSGYYGGLAPAPGYGYGYGGYATLPSWGAYQTPYGNQSWYSNGPNTYVSPPNGYQGYSYGPGYRAGGIVTTNPYRFYPW